VPAKRKDPAAVGAKMLIDRRAGAAGTAFKLIG
jgi:hypothetical protein